MVSIEDLDREIYNQLGNKSISISMNRDEIHDLINEEGNVEKLDQNINFLFYLLTRDNGYSYLPMYAPYTYDIMSGFIKIFKNKVADLYEGKIDQDFLKVFIRCYDDVLPEILVKEIKGYPIRSECLEKCMLKYPNLFIMKDLHTYFCDPPINGINMKVLDVMIKDVDELFHEDNSDMKVNLLGALCIFNGLGKSRIPIVEYLINKGSNIYLTFDGKTLCDLCEYEDVYDYLLNKGVKSNIPFRKAGPGINFDAFSAMTAIDYFIKYYNIEF